MPVKRKASSSSGLPMPSKVAKRDEVPVINRTITIITDYIREGNPAAASRYLQELLSVRDKRISQFIEAVATRQGRPEGEDDVVEELREQITNLQQELATAKKSRDDCMKETQSLIRSESALRNDVAKAHDENHRRTEHMAKALTMALGLSAEIRVWKDAQKNLQSALSDDAATALDIGRANASEVPPSYLLDPVIAQKIVDHYEQRVNRSVEKMCSHLANVEQEKEGHDEA
ncbi:hypothetical protein PG993_013677 [Apiospora rasikravindrae]|uniref:Uncharacterized protein n=1 Tax=Apiospora rasikravindrae TaxID=990691 RepID=A0ABR1RQV2_9PEZI